MGKLTWHGGTLKIAVVKTIHTQGSEAVKVGGGSNLQGCLSFKGGMALITKTIENKQNTSHRQHAVIKKV
jgi:hypothetical protein